MNCTYLTRNFTRISTKF